MGRRRIKRNTVFGGHHSGYGDSFNSEVHRTHLTPKGAHVEGLASKFCFQYSLKPDSPIDDCKILLTVQGFPSTYRQACVGGVFFGVDIVVGEGV